MLSIKDIKFNDQMILNGGKFILVKLLPVYGKQNETGKEEPRIGTKMIVALTAHQLKKIEVIIDDIVVCSPFNELQLAEVVFSDFEGYFSPLEGAETTVFHGSASRFKLVTGTQS